VRTADSYLDVAADFGDVDAEYTALVDACALVDRAAAVVSIVGADAATFLQGQVAADAAGLAPGDGAESLLLTPQGKPVSCGYLLRLADDAFFFVVDRPTVDETVAALRRFLLRVDVEVTHRPDSAVFSLCGPGALDVAGAAFGPVPDAPLSHRGSEWADRVVRARDGGLGGVHVLVTGDDFTVEDAVAAGRTAVDARRVELVLPQFGVDWDTTTIPHDAGVVPRAVSLDKGCYVGQELIERIHSRGRAVRTPRSVRLTDPTAPIPAPGSVVVADGDDGAVREVGVLTTTARCPQWDASGGLGLLRSELSPGDAVRVGDAAAVVV
jgi:folate-binding protein YgfZ